MCVENPTRYPAVWKQHNCTSNHGGMARPERIEKMEDHESFLICTNPKCRYLVDLREGNQVLDRSSLVIAECPECGYPWSSSCPFCGRRLKATRRGNISHCAHCKKKLLPLKNGE